MSKTTDHVINQMNEGREGMSTRSPMKPCLGRGPRRGVCPNLINIPGTCCAECLPYEKKAVWRYDQARGNSGERGYTAQWQKVREMKASRDPLCEVCLLGGDEVPLDVVHHIKSIETHPELRLVMENLLSVCMKHHEKLHSEDRFGRSKNVI